MAQTQTQIVAAQAGAAYHLELRLLELPAEPQRSGLLRLPATVSACYRSPARLLRGSQVALHLKVAVAADPPPPGDQHLLWSALRTGLSVEVLANGDLPLLRPVDGGFVMLSGPLTRPALTTGVRQPEAAASGWRRLWRRLGGR